MTKNEGKYQNSTFKRMSLDRNAKLADLMYGHGDKFVCSLRGKFQPEKHPGSPAIQICELKCGCWIVADGNNRVGMILRENPNATLADIPNSLISIQELGAWDVELMEWWNPSPKSFRTAMRNKSMRNSEKGFNDKDIVHGVIEKEADGSFFAISYALGVDKAISATGSTTDEAAKRLENRIKTVLDRKRVTLELTAMNQLEDHICHGTA